MLAAVASPALLKLLEERESEQARFEGQLRAPMPVVPSATILPHPALLKLFDEKVGRLRETLNAETVCGEAAEVLSALIGSVTIYPNSEHGPEAEVVAKVGNLLTWVTNDDAAREGGAGRFMALVAGTGPISINSS
jgi:site-specific DNA recombinase